MVEKLFQFFIKTVTLITNFLPSSCMLIQNNDIIPATFQTIYGILPLTNTTLLTAYLFYVVPNVLHPIDDFLFLFQRKNIIPCSYCATFFPTNLKYTQYI